MINSDYFYGDLFGQVGCEFVEDECVSDSVLSVYAVLRTLFYDSTRDNMYYGKFSIASLYEIFNATTTNQRNPIKEALSYLLKNKYIKLYDIMLNNIDLDFDNISKIYVVVFLKDNSYDQDGEDDLDNQYDGHGEKGFFKVPILNIHSIITFLKHNKTKIHKHKFIRYYLYIARRCSNQDLCGYVTMKTVKDLLGISAKICSEYNSILKDINVIYYNNDYGKTKSDGSIKLMCTMYGHKNLKYDKDSTHTLTKEKFEEMVNNYVSQKGYVLINKEKLSNRVSEKMKDRLKGID